MHYTPPPHQVSLSATHVRTIIELGLKKNQKIFFILDGLDECPFSVQGEVLTQLREVQCHGNLSICISSGQRSEVLETMLSQFKEPVSTSQSTPNPELRAYIDNEIVSWLRSRRSRVTNPTLVDDIFQTLHEDCNRMFHVVGLHLWMLRHCNSEIDTRWALERLPGTLEETYNRMFADDSLRLDGPKKAFLEIILAAQRPLKKEELREAMNITPGEYQYDPDRIPNHIAEIWEDFEFLVNVDEEDSVVTLVHSSIAQYLLNRQNGILSYSDCSLSIVMRGLTSINYSTFERRVGPAFSSTDISGAPAQVHFYDCVETSFSPFDEIHSTII